MRAYHFTSSEHARSNIEHRRLKIACIHELNDPFELLAQDLTDTVWRQRFLTIKDQANGLLGFLCFSRTWSNPLMWSHYADRHKGICLGFDIPDEPNSLPVKYSDVRSNVIQSCFSRGQEPSLDQMIEWLQTKFDGWRYEVEVRLVCPLAQAVAANGLYFSPFSQDLRLREVIIGAACETQTDLVHQAEALVGEDVDIIRAKLADNTFDVVAAVES